MDSTEPRQSAGGSVPSASVIARFHAVSDFKIPLNDGSEFEVPLDDLAEWEGVFPGVDVGQELREMRAWSLANPTKRKTRMGVRRFVVTWLSREQDKGGKPATPKRPLTAAEIREQIDKAKAGGGS